jgi:hypothetical protein
MNRKNSMRFLKIAAIMFMTCFLLSCGGGGGGGGETTTLPPTATGSIELPDGFSIDKSTLKVMTGAGTATVDTNGTFQVPLTGVGTSLCTVTDMAGHVILLGHISATGSQNIGPKETAVALIFLALGAMTLPADQQDTAANCIAQASATDTLAAVIAARIAVNPTAVTDGDQNIIDALGQALNEIKDGTDLKSIALQAEWASCPVSLAKSIPEAQLMNSQAIVSGVPQVVLTLVNPTNPQEGLQLGPNPSGDGLIMMNNYRRAAMIYAYRVGTEDDNGNRTDENPISSAMTPLLMDPTTSLAGSIQTVTDIAQGKVFWTQVETPPFTLPLAVGSAKTFYSVIAVGPTFDIATPEFFADSKFADYAPIWNAEILAMSGKAFVKDLLLPTIFTWLIDTQKINKFMGISEDVETLSQDIASLIFKTSPSVQESVQKGNWSEAAITVMNDMAGSSNLRNGMITLIRNALAKQAVLDLFDPDLALKALSSTNAIVSAIDKVMTFGDIGAVIKDIGSSSPGLKWDVTVSKANVQLNPASATVEASHSVDLTGQVKPQNLSGILTYKWSVQGTNGTLQDSLGHSGTGFDSSSPQASYVANATVVDGQVDVVKLAVYYKPDAGSGVTHADPIYLGEATSSITVTAPLCCTDVDYASFKSGCGSLLLSSLDVTAGDNITASVNSGCGEVDLSVDYTLDNVVVDGVPTTANGSFSMYSYWGWPYYPAARRNGAVVHLPGGSHTVEFTVRFSAPNDCVFLDPSISTNANGPWAVLSGTGGWWSTVVPFRVRQKGI